MSNFGIFYDARSPNMAMSRDPRSKFRKKFYFFLILHLILGKAAKLLLEKLSTSEAIIQKPHGGLENTPPPARVLLGLTITNITWYIRIIQYSRTLLITKFFKISE